MKYTTFCRGINWDCLASLKKYNEIYENIIRSQSKKKLNIWNSASVSRRRMRATVVLCSGDFKLYFHTSHITPLQLVTELRGLSERVFSALGDFLQVEKWRILKSNVFAWNSVSNWEKPLRRLFRCCNSLMGRTVWAVRNVTSGISVSNRAERPSKMIPKSGRPSPSTGDDHIEKVRSLIRENRRLTVREVSEEVGICKSSCHTILTEKLKMHRVAAKFVPRLLTE